MSEIYLIRHGQASFGSKNYDRLSDKGVAQAYVLGKHLAALNVKFDVVCHGEMDRQHKTAMGVVRAYHEKDLFLPELEIDKSFNEYDATSVWNAQVGQLLEDDPKFLEPLEKNPKDNVAFQKVFSKVVNRWVSGKYDSPGDVIWEDFRLRVTGGLTSLMEREGPSKKIAIFSSGGPISAAVQMALELSDITTMDLSFQVINASVTKLKYNADRVSLTGFNDITHLELTGDQTLLTYR
jgi:broad specificity phosphatase PhoE